MDRRRDHSSPFDCPALAGDRVVRITACDSSLALQVSRAIGHLERALVTVDGLVARSNAQSSSGHVLYELGEASHLMHDARLVLRRAAHDPVGATHAPSVAPPPLVRQD